MDGIIKSWNYGEVVGPGSHSLVPRLALVIGVMLMSSSGLARQTEVSTSWLDRPLVNWNAASSSPPSTPGAPGREGVRTRCPASPTRTEGHGAVEAAGWIAYDHLDRPLAQGDIEIVAGMSDADATCQPKGFQIFVFVAGKLAGTLSPVPMTTGQDASAGAVRIVGSDAISAEFARYGSRDVPCCPTSRVTVRYRIEHSDSQPVLVPIDVRTTRSH